MVLLKAVCWAIIFLTRLTNVDVNTLTAATLFGDLDVLLVIQYGIGGFFSGIQEFREPDYHEYFRINYLLIIILIYGEILYKKSVRYRCYSPLLLT